MSKIYLHASILLVLVTFASGKGWGGIFSSSTEEDCVIDAMRSAQTHDAAAIARNACRDKFERLELQNVRELGSDEVSALSASATLSAAVPLNSMTPAIQKAVQDGTYHKKFGSNSLQVVATNNLKDVIIRKLTIELIVESVSQGTYEMSCRLKPGKTETLRIDIKPVRDDQQWSYRIVGGAVAPVSY